MAGSEEGRRLARDDVRGGCWWWQSEGDEVRVAVASAIRFVAQVEEGGRVMATDGVRGVLVAMAAIVRARRVRVRFEAGALQGRTIRANFLPLQQQFPQNVDRIVWSCADLKLCSEPCWFGCG